MKRFAFIAGSAVLAMAVVVPMAIGSHPHPKKSGKVQVEFVGAFNQCIGPGNATHRPAIAFPSCSPPVASTNNNAANVMDFSSKGKVSSKIQADTKNGDVKLQGKGTGILDNGAPFTGNAVATANTRATDHGCGAGPSYGVPCTIVDFPFPVLIACEDGKCKLKSSANTVVPNAVHAGDESNIEVGQVVINDPDGDAAAKQGVFVP